MKVNLQLPSVDEAFVLNGEFIDFTHSITFIKKQLSETLKVFNTVNEFKVSIFRTNRGRL